MHLVGTEELNQNFCEVNYAVQRRHHLMRDISGKQAEKAVLRLECVYLFQAGKVIHTKDEALLVVEVERVAGDQQDSYLLSVFVRLQLNQDLR